MKAIKYAIKHADVYGDTIEVDTGLRSVAFITGEGGDPVALDVHQVEAVIHQLSEFLVRAKDID